MRKLVTRYKCKVGSISIAVLAPAITEKSGQRDFEASPTAQDQEKRAPIRNLPYRGWSQLVSAEARRFPLPSLSGYAARTPQAEPSLAPANFSPIPPGLFYTQILSWTQAFVRRCAFHFMNLCDGPYVVQKICILEVL